ncbi:MAG: DUF2332 domain-containing protein [Caldilineaceae bacterium]|nr:DUF2332 domain-containing protein [Caldilineaceae bacterium]
MCTDLTLAERFRAFAYSEVEETSPLYHNLALAVADDAELLALAAAARNGQPPANLLFGAVHYLLQEHGTHDLASYYPSLSPSPARPEAAFPAFRDFCLIHRNAISALLGQRLVQTNELRRCTYLWSAFSEIARLTGGTPVALLEVGASAGLNLLLDRYQMVYRLGEMTVVAGAPAASVVLDTTVRKGQGSLFSLVAPTIARRVGLDLNVLDLRKAEDYRWLRALIWPEHAERLARLERARALWLEAPPALIAGDALLHLPHLLAEVPAGITPVVFHTHVLNQLTYAARNQLHEIVVAASSDRTIYRVGNDMGGADGKAYTLRLLVYRSGNVEERILGRVDGHGRWLTWLAA